MILELLESMSAGAEIGAAVGGLFDSEHADDYNVAVDIYRTIDFENPEEQTIRDALYHFNKVNDEDKLYVRCWAWYNMAFCYALLLNFSRAYSCLNAIERAETDFFTMKKNEIQETKELVREARAAIKEVEAEWKAEQERIKREEERKRKEEEERTKRELEQRIRKETDQKKSGLSIPIVITIVVLVAIITCLICYILFNK